MSQKAKSPSVDEPVVPSVARERVNQHLRSLFTMGAASVSLAACPIVCDPLPPPAACRDAGTLTPHIDAHVELVAHSSDIRLVLTEKDPHGSGGIMLEVVSVSGATQAGGMTYGANLGEVRLVPDAPTAVIQVVLSTLCESQPKKNLLVTLTPVSADGGAADGGSANYQVQVTDAP